MEVGTKTVVLAGATGNLGSLIAEAILAKPDVKLRALLRPGSRAKGAALADRGIEIVETELAGPDADKTLAPAMDGAYSVVSALQGGSDVIIGAQTILLEAARRGGVAWFIPSDFSYNIFGLAEGDNISTDLRRGFARKADEVRGALEVVHVLNGCFLDRRVLFGFLGAIDPASRKAFLWGAGDAPMDFTTYVDTARFTAEAALDPEPLPREFNVAGDTLNFHQLVRAYEEASGKSVTVVRMGTLEDMSAEIERRRKADPENMFAWLPLMYWRAMLNGTGKLGPLINDRYPHIEPETVREFVRREGV